MKDQLNTIVEIINTILEEERIGKDDLELNIEEVGFNSLMFIHLIIALETECDVVIPDEYLMLSEFNTLKKIMKNLEEIKKLSHEVLT